MENRKGQAVLGGVFWLLITFALLGAFFPVFYNIINTAILSNPSADAETKLAWTAVPFLILIAAIIGMFYYYGLGGVNRQQGGNGGSGGF